MSIRMTSYCRTPSPPSPDDTDEPTINPLNVKSLSFKGGAITNKDLPQLSIFENLQILDLSRNPHLNLAGLAYLQALPLRQLHLSQSPGMSDTVLLGVLTQIPSLELVDVRGCLKVSLFGIARLMKFFESTYGKSLTVLHNFKREG